MLHLNRFNDKNQDHIIDVARFASITQDKPSSLVSEKYKFIPTTRALKVLEDFGWHPVAAVQANTRIEENRGYQKHAIRLINERSNRELVVGSTVPQILLTNAHSGTSAFEMTVALFEKVCSNGLVVSRGDAARVRVCHRGYADENMAKALSSLTPSIPEILQQTDIFKATYLTDEERKAYAKSAIELRFDGDKYAVDSSSMLRTYRSDEKAPTLWNTYNVVQEKIIKGGVRQVRQDGSVIRSREVKNIGENIRLNKALWTLTEKMAELKGLVV